MSNFLDMPAIIIKDVTLLPNMNVNFSVIKKEAARACEDAMHKNQLVFVVNQTENSDKPLKASLYDIGVVARIRQINKLPNQALQLMLFSTNRGRLIEVLDDDCTTMRVEEIFESDEMVENFEKEAMLRNLRDIFEEYNAANPKLAKTLPQKLRETHCLYELVDEIAGNTPLPYELKLSVLQTLDVRRRFFVLFDGIRKEIEIAKIREDIKKASQERVSKIQREYYLRDQLTTIKKELGEGSESEEEKYLAAIDALNASDEIKNKLKKEVSRLSGLNGAGGEAQVVRNYVDTLLELPWDNESEDSKDFLLAEKILDEDHYGLKDIKERIIDFLAVRMLNPKGDSPIICLVGPPGTGKTSIAKSIARALNKKYVRVSLGGVRDEAEIRGHRRTYIGAMPGNIVNGLKQAGVKNPLILLDEIDKTSGDYKGDTSAALLEVLDSEQNVNFVDHFVGLPMDLSKVMFIATANDADNIPRPLYDRMEIIEINSYTANEKLHIAKDFLVKKQLEKNGLEKKQLKFSDSALKKIISAYTKEAGVRNLERKISTVCRKVARQVLENPDTRVSVTGKNLEEFLGKEKYRAESILKKDEIGAVRGLAWTAVGGTTLLVEVSVMPGKGEIELTGQLGDVMKESALAGLSFVRSIAGKYGVKPKFFNENDIHIHIPEGAVPKDGPSAGITMATAMLSAITKKPVKRNLAMTGEITLRGKVLPIGGLKEKLLAAKEAGITTVLVPEENRADVLEISDEILDGLTVKYVTAMEQVIESAFCDK